MLSTFNLGGQECQTPSETDKIVRSFQLPRVVSAPKHSLQPTLFLVWCLALLSQMGVVPGCDGIRLVLESR